MTLKKAAQYIMGEAYDKASSGGIYPAHARQIMYAARGYIQDASGKELDDQYFCQTLLPDYLRCYPEATANWDVVFDARGHFEEPHTECVVPLGTLDVRDYLQRVRTANTSEPVIEESRLFPTQGPRHRFGAVLFIEKEGFMPLFRAARLAERYDLAIMSTKGVSVTASRLLVDRLCAEHDMPLLVLHDFDKSGFSIVGTLQRSTWRYEFQNNIRVIDLGLRLADVQRWDLKPEDVSYRDDNPTANLRENGATRDEIEFLYSGNKRGRRVELNAFSSGDLLQWIESKLKEHGVKKVVPDQATLEAAYRRSMAAARVRQQLTAITTAAQAEAAQAAVPATLTEDVLAAHRADPSRPWDEVVDEMAGLVTKPEGK